MRVFIIISALMAIASARPQYNYVSGPIGVPSVPFPAGAYNPHSYQEPIVPQAPIVNKQFFIHSAPEDTDNLGKTRHFVLGKPQKNYRVVFIKAPASNNGNVKLSAEYAPQEEKTVIYVLSQKESELDLNNIATPAPTQPSKPEVFFIKYKTPEEAAHAQHEIQAQYDILGGASEVSDEGIAPVSSVEGVLDEQPSNQLPIGYNYPGGPSNGYLPVHA